MPDIMKRNFSERMVLAMRIMPRNKRNLDKAKNKKSQISWCAVLKICARKSVYTGWRSVKKLESASFLKFSGYVWKRAGREYHEKLS